MINYTEHAIPVKSNEIPLRVIPVTLVYLYTRFALTVSSLRFQNFQEKRSHASSDMTRDLMTKFSTLTGRKYSCETQSLEIP